MTLVPVPPVRYRCAVWRVHGPFLLADKTRPRGDLFLFRP
jgi:hypothetical protein